MRIVNGVNVSRASVSACFSKTCLNSERECILVLAQTFWTFLSDVSSVFVRCT